MDIGIDTDAVVIDALKYLEEKIPYSTVLRNEYVTTEGPRIEIVIGNDIGSYFTFAKPAYYLPYLPPSSTGSEEVIQTEKTTISGESKSSNTTAPKKTQTPTVKNTKPNSNTVDLTPTISVTP